jgi:Zn-finger nucleic acid-binding protein
MKCPNEGNEMQPVKVESHYGQIVLLDQCPRCGGIWFDKFELYAVKPGEAQKIDKLNEDILRTASTIEHSELFCPKDNVKLVHFQDMFFPKDIVIARCPVCNGFWLNRGEFTKYQAYRQSLKKHQEDKQKDEKLQKEIALILADHQAGDDTGTLGRVGQFLSTPMDSTTWEPLEPDKLSGKEKNAIAMMMNILLVIFRFFIHI